MIRGCILALALLAGGPTRAQEAWPAPPSCTPKPPAPTWTPPRGEFFLNPLPVRAGRKFQTVMADSLFFRSPGALGVYLASPGRQALPALLEGGQAVRMANRTELVALDDLLIAQGRARHELFGDGYVVLTTTYPDDYLLQTSCRRLEKQNER